MMPFSYLASSDGLITMCGKHVCSCWHLWGKASAGMHCCQDLCRPLCSRSNPLAGTDTTLRCPNVGFLVLARSNPLAGTDTTLLALSGAGYADGRCFGFASCERRAGAAEGANALMERRLIRPDGGAEYAYNVTNVEYTEFDRLGVDDECGEDGGQYSRFPANTNVLYVGLKARPVTRHRLSWLLGALLKVSQCWRARRLRDRGLPSGQPTALLTRQITDVRLGNHTWYECLSSALGTF